jgi:hypothetical protein
MKDQITNKVLEIINELEVGIKTGIPPAIEMAARIVQIDVVQKIGYCILTLLINAIILFFIRKIYKERREEWKKSFGEFNFDMVAFPAIVGGIVSFFVSLITFFILMDPWNYVGLTEPKLYLVHKIVEKVLQ